MALQEGMGRFAAIVGGILLLIILANAFKPKSRQTIELRLTTEGALAAEVEVMLSIPQRASRSPCSGVDPGTIGAGPIGQTSANGSYRWRRRISPDPIGSRYSHRAARRGTYALELCAFVDGRPLRLWQDAPRQAHRMLQLDCSLSTQSCRARYAEQLDETLKPIVEVLAVVILLLVAIAGGTTGHKDAGTGWLYANGFFFPFVQACAGGLHRFPVVSKVVMVLVLIWGALVLIGLLMAWVRRLGDSRR